MAFLLILFALFGFVFAGIGSGSTSSGSAQAPAPAPAKVLTLTSVHQRAAPTSLRAKNTGCVVVTWEKGAPSQQRPCRRSPAKP